jgi:hypothetical protein
MTRYAPADSGTLASWLARRRCFSSGAVRALSHLLIQRAPPPGAVLLRPLQAARDIRHGDDSTPPVGFRKMASRVTPKRITWAPIVLMYPATGRIVPCSTSV